jgi:hypothetical protein
LLTNIRELEERDREIRRKNERMETDLSMAMELQQALTPNVYPSFPATPTQGPTRLRCRPWNRTDAGLVGHRLSYPARFCNFWLCGFEI